jgi:hypothetical protein
MAAPDWKDYYIAYISRHTPTGCVKRLEIKSANCAVTSVKAHSGQAEEHFIKCQINPESDDLLCDNINNVLLARFLEKTLYKGCITKFVDSFPVNIGFKNDLTAATGKKYYINTSKHWEMASDEISSGITADGTERQNVNIQVKIFNAIQLSNVNPDLFETRKFQILLLELFKMFITLGSYNFSHNDAHAGNIMVTNQKFVLIDYGRCVFDVNTVNQLWADPMLDDLKTKLNKVNTYPTYSDMIQDYVKPHTMGYLLDISTITMGLLTKSPDPSLLLGGIMTMKSTLTIDGNVDTIIFTTDRASKSASRKFSAILFEIIKAGGIMNLFIPGIYIFVKFIEHNDQLQTGVYSYTAVGNHHTIEINFKHPRMVQNIYYSFQYMQALIVGSAYDAIKKSINEYFEIGLQPPPPLQPQPPRPRPRPQGAVPPQQPQQPQQPQPQGAVPPQQPQPPLPRPRPRPRPQGAVPPQQPPQVAVQPLQPLPPSPSHVSPTDTSMRDASPYVTQQYSGAASNQGRLDAYRVLERGVQDWVRGCNAIAYNMINTVDTVISFCNYTDVTTKVMQCLRMMHFCSDEHFRELYSYVSSIIMTTTCTNGELNSLILQFETLKQKVLAAYSNGVPVPLPVPLPVPMIISGGMNRKRYGRQKGGDGDVNGKSYFEALEIAEKKRRTALNALNIVNEHFILGYDTPPNSRIWNIVNEYYGFGEIKTNRKK